MGPTRSHNFVIPSQLDRITSVIESIASDMVTHGYGEKVQFAVRLALEEAISNAIRHGNKGDPKKTVGIDYDVDPQRIIITVCDQGPGFKPDTVPDPTLEENLTRPCGRGVMLMKAYMDEVSFNQQAMPSP
ncbi:MAG: ATP-binding protein [Phycisphaerales bacterium]|nr:ATP-binding protein [Phycisphaerales bacterium]